MLRGPRVACPRVQLNRHLTLHAVRSVVSLCVQELSYPIPLGDVHAGNVYSYSLSTVSLIIPSHDTSPLSSLLKSRDGLSDSNFLPSHDLKR